MIDTKPGPLEEIKIFHDIFGSPSTRFDLQHLDPSRDAGSISNIFNSRGALAREIFSTP